MMCVYACLANSQCWRLPICSWREDFNVVLLLLFSQKLRVTVALLLALPTCLLCIK